MSIKLDELQELLVQASIPNDKIKIVLQDAKDLEEKKKEEREANKAPKSKNEFVIVVRGDEQLKAALAQGWVMSVKTGDDVSTLPERFVKAAREHNSNVKKGKGTLLNWGDFFQRLKRVYSKMESFQIKTKEPVRVVVITNETFR
jgi:hypothetical protein